MDTDACEPYAFTNSGETEVSDEELSHACFSRLKAVAFFWRLR
jgi:hypothetical protein